MSAFKVGDAVKFQSHHAVHTVLAVRSHADTGELMYNISCGGQSSPLWVQESLLTPVPATLETLVEQVVAWANDRNLINGSTSVQQGLKLMSEYGELCDSIAKNDLDGIKDGIGDVAVVAIIINAIQANPFAVGYYERNKRYSVEGTVADDDAMEHYMCYTFSRELAYMITGRSHVEWLMCCLEVIANHYKLTLTECLQHAYDEIKDRKGVMFNGVFIKESDPRYENAVKELSNGTSQN